MSLYMYNASVTCLYKEGSGAQERSSNPRVGTLGFESQLYLLMLLVMLRASHSLDYIRNKL